MSGVTASIIMPAYNEGAAIARVLDALLAAVATPCEVLVVFDSPEDPTASVVHEYSKRDPRVKPTLNAYGRGPGNAMRFGLDAAAAPVTVVTMADGSDDPSDIDDLVRLVRSGASIAVPSRYMRGGAQHGGPRFKAFLSRVAGVSLYWCARVGTHDATSAFKAYSTPFLREVGVQSDGGFSMGIELVAKARRLRLPVAEIPTIWHDRTVGVTNFRVLVWLPKYLRWYFFAFGRRLTLEELRERTGAV